MLDSLSIIPHVVKDQTIHSIQATDSTYVAAQLMEEHNVSAIVVLGEDEKLIGIVTERDMVREVVARNLHADSLPVGEIMTHKVLTAHPDDSAFAALERMREIKVRHLPVTAEDRVVGMVSMRDLRNYIATHPPKPAGKFSALFARFR